MLNSETSSSFSSDSPMFSFSRNSSFGFKNSVPTNKRSDFWIEEIVLLFLIAPMLHSPHSQWGGWYCFHALYNSNTKYFVWKSSLCFWPYNWSNKTKRIEIGQSFCTLDNFLHIFGKLIVTVKVTLSTFLYTPKKLKLVPMLDRSFK